MHGLATYPPFAAAAFTPLLLVPDAAVGHLSLVVNLVLLLAASYLSLRRVTARVDLGVAVPLLAAVALWCEPVMASNGFGQINLLLLCLVLWDFSLPEHSRWRGVGIGLAAALKVTPGIFIVYLLVTKRFRAALGAVVTLLATLAVSAALAPSSTWGFWRHHVFDPSRVGRLENSLNQSVRGWIVRATHTLDTGALAIVATAAVAVVGLAAAAFCYRRAGDRWGLLVAALTGLLMSPISWSHHWVWCLPLLALAWYEARALLIPTLLVFWTHVVWLVPHGDHVELGLSPGEVAMSGWYVVYAAGFVVVAVAVARSRDHPVVDLVVLRYAWRRGATLDRRWAMPGREDDFRDSAAGPSAHGLHRGGGVGVGDSAGGRADDQRQLEEQHPGRHKEGRQHQLARRQRHGQGPWRAGPRERWRWQRPGSGRQRERRP